MVLRVRLVADVRTAKSSAATCQRERDSSLSSSHHESAAVKMIFDCWISEKAEAEMRRSETKESKFISRKMSAGIAIFADVAAR